MLSHENIVSCMKMQWRQLWKFQCKFNKEEVGLCTVHTTFMFLKYSEACTIKSKLENSFVFVGSFLCPKNWWRGREMRVECFELEYIRGR